jgi:hypothetical protein
MLHAISARVHPSSPKGRDHVQKTGFTFRRLQTQNNTDNQFKCVSGVVEVERAALVQWNFSGLYYT